MGQIDVLKYSKGMFAKKKYHAIQQHKKCKYKHKINGITYLEVQTVWKPLKSINHPKLEDIHLDETPVLLFANLDSCTRVMEHRIWRIKYAIY